MPKHIDAVYEHGALHPLAPLSPVEHQRLRLTAQLALLSWHANEQADDRAEEMNWLAKESSAYSGQWVALQADLFAQLRDSAREVIGPAEVEPEIQGAVLAVEVTEKIGAVLLVIALQKRFCIDVALGCQMLDIAQVTVLRPLEFR